jgi:4-carboxymuconolactone decarboxylase
MTEQYDAGMAVRREVMGDDYVDRSVSRTTDLTEPFQDYITSAIWGSIWTRPGLDRRTRSCLTLALLTASRAHDELALHVRGALRNGVTREEIAEVILHAGAYVGAPQANSAMAVVRQVLSEVDGD